MTSEVLNESCIHTKLFHKIDMNFKLRCTEEAFHDKSPKVPSNEEDFRTWYHTSHTARN